MTDWTPPVRTGLTGDVILSEHMEAFVDDLADAHAPGVYVLKCSHPDEWDVAESRFAEAFEKPRPDYVREAYDAECILYVGAAKDVYDRIGDHARGEKSSALLKVYPPHSVWGVYWMDSTEEAFTRESGVAAKLASDFPFCYVHQR